MRGTTTTGQARGALEPRVDTADEGIDGVEACECGINIGVQGGFGVKWGDYDDDALCARCTRTLGQAMSTGNASVKVDRGGSFGSHHKSARADENLSESVGVSAVRANRNSAALDRLLDDGPHCKYVRETSCQPTDSVASVGSRAVGETTDPSHAQISVLGKSKFRRIRRWLPRHLRSSERRAEVADPLMRNRRRRSDGYNPSQIHV